MRHPVHGAALLVTLTVLPGMMLAQGIGFHPAYGLADSSWRSPVMLSPARPPAALVHAGQHPADAVIRQTSGTDSPLQCPMPVFAPDTVHVDRMLIVRPDTNSPARIPVTASGCVNPLRQRPRQR